MKKVLVTDDYPDTAASLATYLETHGYQTSTADNGVEALHKMTEDKPDLMIVDLMMPERNGWEMLDAKAKMPEFNRIPVIVHSAYLEIPEQLPGVAAVFNKPTEPRTLLEKVRSIIGE